MKLKKELENEENVINDDNPKKKNQCFLLEMKDTKEGIMNLGVVVVFAEIIIFTFFSTLDLFIPINIYYLIMKIKYLQKAQVLINLIKVHQ